MKGAGKTAFLRYIQLKMDEDQCLTKFISFANEISDAERSRIIKEAHIKIYEQKGIEAINECVSMWILFILNQIAQLIEENEHVFTTNRNIKIFCELMEKLHDAPDKTVLTWLQGVFKRGKYKFKSKYLEVTGKGASSDLEREYTIDQIVARALEMLKHLSWEGKKRVYIFFDELNLSFASRAQHKRDSVLIRDLIIAIDRVNTIFIQTGKPIYLLASARSEVLNVITEPTHEINKILGDRGRELRWFPTTAGGDWPILHLFVRKIKASEAVAGYPITQDVFHAYFQSGLFGMTAGSFVLELTWCNPRDLVLLFGEAASKAERGEWFFGEQTIRRVLDRYSSEAWREKMEELNVEYSPVEIASLKKILLGFRPTFRVADFEHEARTKGEDDQNVRQFQAKRNAAKVLEDLYRIGIIGQATTPEGAGRAFAQFREHWAYRGDSNFDPTAWMVIHRALWSDLRLGRITLDPGLMLRRHELGGVRRPHHKRR